MDTTGTCKDTPTNLLSLKKPPNESTFLNKAIAEKETNSPFLVLKISPTMDAAPSSPKERRRSSSSTAKNDTPSKSSVRRMSAINRASFVAKASKDMEKATNASEYINNSKDALEFQMLALQAQLKLLEDLACLSDDEKLDTIFQLLDKNSAAHNMFNNQKNHIHHHQQNMHNGMIHAEYLSSGFRKITGEEEFLTKVDAALEKVSHFETEGHGQLTFDSFTKYAETMSQTIGCSIYEVLEMIVMNVLFSPSLMMASTKDEDCHDVLQDIVDDINSELTDDKIAVRQKFDDHAKYQRMKALFDMFDYAHDEKIHFKEVVLGMYKLTEDVQGTARAAMTALMLCEEDDMRSMNFVQFTRFIENVLTASSTLTLDHIADVMTRDVANKDLSMSPDQISELFAMDTCLKEVLYISEDAQEEEVDAACDEHICFGKANRLFQLWDLDHDGYINFHDLALGLRKLEETTPLKKTMEEAEQILEHFDATHNKKLSNREFFYFLTKFAEKTEYHLSEMIDSMVVAFILKENTAKEIRIVDAFAYGVDGPPKSEGDVQTYG